jgi:hypothetical protein
MNFSKASRTTDPISSHEAERMMNDSGARVTQSYRVLSVLRDHPGSTALELSTASNAGDRYMFNRRLPDLEKAGLAYRGQVRQCNVANKKAQEWYAK